LFGSVAMIQAVVNAFRVMYKDEMLRCVVSSPPPPNPRVAFSHGCLQFTWSNIFLLCKLHFVAGILPSSFDFFVTYCVGKR
jgi:hypothetical protein